MNVLSEQENKLAKLLATMENIEFDETQIILNIEEDEYIIKLSREVSDFDHTDEEKKERITKVKIICEDQERLTLQRCYKYRYIKSGDGAGYKCEDIDYDGSELLLNGEEVCITGHAYDIVPIKNEITPIKKQRKIEINGKQAAITIKNSDHSDSLDIAITFDEDATNNIPFKSVEKSSNIIRLIINCYLVYIYDENEKKYYFENHGETITLDDLETNFTTIEEELIKVNKSIKKAISISKKEGMSNIVRGFSPIRYDQLERIKLQRESIATAKEFIEEVIANNYFEDDFLWISLNEEILEKINDAIVERLADIKTKNMEQNTENYFNRLNEEEKEYIKVLLKRQEDSKKKQS